MQLNMTEVFRQKMTERFISHLRDIIGPLRLFVADGETLVVERKVVDIRAATDRPGVEFVLDSAVSYEVPEATTLRVAIAGPGMVIYDGSFDVPECSVEFGAVHVGGE